AVGPRRELLSKISSAVTGYHHRDFARTRLASTRLLLVGDKPNLNSTSQRTDTPPRAECSLSSKSARYSQRLAPCERSTHAAQLIARCYSCDPGRGSLRTSHQSGDGKRDSIRSSASCRRSGDRA